MRCARRVCSRLSGSAPSVANQLTEWLLQRDRDLSATDFAVPRVGTVQRSELPSRPVSRVTVLASA